MIVNIHDAKTQLSKLLISACEGEEVIIAKAGKPIAQLVPYVNKKAKRKPGSAKGKIILHEGFYGPLTEEELSELGI